MRDWDLFLRLQADLPHDLEILSPKEIPTRDGAGTLFIGPGGPDELRAMAGRLPHPFTALTVHEAEAQKIRDALPDVTAVCGDMHDMPFPSWSFAAIHALQVLEHAFAPYIALMQFRRVLGSNGAAYISLPSFDGVEGGRGPYHLHCLDNRVWRELLHKTGLDVVEEKIEHGDADPECAYTSFVCKPVHPPRPHDIILQRLIEARE